MQECSMEHEAKKENKEKGILSQLKQQLLM